MSTLTVSAQGFGSSLLGAFKSWGTYFCLGLFVLVVGAIPLLSDRDSTAYSVLYSTGMILWLTAGFLLLFKELPVRAAICLALVFPVTLASLCVEVSSKKGIWVNTKSKETTHSERVLFFKPFEPSVYFLNKKQGTHVRVNVIARDSVPMSCGLNLSGIVLDQRDGSGMEKKILAFDANKNPQEHIYTALNQEVTRLTETILKTKSSSDIYEFAKDPHITHYIGSQLSTTLSSLGLRWHNGEVVMWCDLVLNS